MNMFHPDNIALTDVLHALSDANRLQIARNLYKANAPLTCTQAAEGVEDLAISTRSHCFKLLRENGVIRSDKQGRECYNSLRLEEIEKLYPGVLTSILD